MAKSLDEAVARRIEQAMPEILRSLEMAREGRPLMAEPNRDRARRRIRAKAPAVAMATAAPEKIWGDTIDFVNVAFLAKGAQVARAVGRVAFRDGRAQGSGFLIGDGLFLTNNHVLAREADAGRLCIEFDYELDLQGRPRSVTRFSIDAGVFVTSPEDALDYTIFAIGPKLDGAEDLETFGCVGLSDAPDKHMLGEVANIVQHPDGRFKEVVLRENRLVGRYDGALHYVADTEPGSSGSPVFNSEWQVIALHHWGGPWIQRVDANGAPLPQEINEGIRISAIVADLRQQLPGLNARTAPRIAAVLAAGENRTAADPLATKASGGPPAAGAPRVEADGRVTWTVPIELSVRLPGFGPPPAGAGAAAAAVLADAQVSAVAVSAGGENTPQKDYKNRKGYRRRFITGHVVELPVLTAAQREAAARNKLAEPGDDPVVLNYHHFSVVMNRLRRLAFFTACNIDGRTAKKVDRKTKKVVPLGVDDLEERLDVAESAEASESWYDDPRLDLTDFAGTDIYSGQKVPGFPKPSDPRRIARMFQRGHLVRRMDPCWGEDSMALAAEADTFHWTNCSPQVGFFNMGTASRSQAGGGKMWRALEDYVLRNAVGMDTRICCFTGPIFDDAADRVFRSIKVPGRFFKVVVWAEGGALRSVAMIADQRPVISVWPESLGEEALFETQQAEAFGDPGELDRVEDFLSTVTAVEAATGLDFGENVRAADIRGGEPEARIDSLSDLPLTPGSKADEA
jgi:endonuclease G